MNPVFYFTGDDSQVMNRSKYLRAAIRLSGLTLIKAIPSAQNAKTDSVWIHGLSHDQERPVLPKILKNMSLFPGKLVLLMNDDRITFHLNKIPGEIRNKIQLFVRNQWPAEASLILPEILGKTAYQTPIFQPFPPNPGKLIFQRINRIIFYGKATGGLNLNGTENQRIKAVTLLKNSGLPFSGGLVEDDALPFPDLLKIKPVSAQEHSKLLSESTLCLALWGNAELTYRLFEGFSKRCLVLCPSLSGVHFLDFGLTPGVHFIELKPDLSDLIENTNWYLNHPDEAQKIAQNGFDFFKTYFSFSGLSLPVTMVSEIRKSWRGLMPDHSVAFSTVLTRTRLRFTNSI